MNCYVYVDQMVSLVVAGCPMGYLWDAIKEFDRIEAENLPFERIKKQVAFAGVVGGSRTPALFGGDPNVFPDDILIGQFCSFCIH